MNYPFQSSYDDLQPEENIDGSGFEDRNLNDDLNDNLNDDSSDDFYDDSSDDFYDGTSDDLNKPRIKTVQAIVVEDDVREGTIKRTIQKQMPLTTQSVLTIFSIEDYLMVNVTQKFKSYSCNVTTIIRKAGDDVTIAGDEINKQQKLIEAMALSKAAIQQPFKPWLRGLPFALFSPLLVFFALRSNNQSYLEHMAAIVSDTMPGGVVPHKLKTEWQTVHYTKTLDVIDRTLLRRLNFHNGTLFCSFHPDLYLQHSHRYFGLFKTKS